MYNISPYAQPRSSYPEPINPPGVDPDAGPFVSVLIQIDWLPIVLGCLSQLFQRTTWNYATEADLILAIDRARLLTNLIGQVAGASPGVTPGTIPLIRFDPTSGQVQTSTDGGTTWTSTPSANPQNQTLLPPLTGAGANCNSARSEIAYLGRFLDLLTSLSFGLDTTAFASAVTSFVVADLTGPWGVIFDLFVTFAAYAISVGLTAIQAALNSTNLATLLCIIFCNLNAENQVDDSALSTIEAQVTAQIGGTDAAIINTILALHGAGGMNDAMARNYDAGSCPGCTACTWCETFDLTVTQPPEVSYNPGQFTPGTGVIQVFVSAGNAYEIRMTVQLPSNSTLTFASVVMSSAKWATGTQNTIRLEDNAGTVLATQTTTHTVGSTPGTETRTWTGSQVGVHQVLFALDCQNVAGHSGVMTSITLKGTGDNPFGSSNCT